jgi:hypothetical protein
MPGFDNEVVYAKNVDFSNGYPVSGKITTDGQLLIGSTAFPNIMVGYITSSDASITVTNGPGTIDITTAGGGITWSAISADQTLAVDNGYLCIGGATLNLALPVISAVGTTIEVSLDGATGFNITQAAGQSIKLGNQTTSAGVGGSLSSTQQGDSVRMVCKTANLAWTIVSAMGNLTFV